MKILGNVVVFVILYILFMLPTYYLPYAGSNSAVVGAVVTIADAGTTQATWLHIGSLIALIVIAWFRGVFVDKKWLIIFPIVAAVFDMAPALNLIPLVPTIMHILAITLGAIGAKTIVSAAEQNT